MGSEKRDNGCINSYSDYADYQKKAEFFALVKPAWVRESPILVQKIAVNGGHAERNDIQGDYFCPARDARDLGKDQ